MFDGKKKGDDLPDFDWGDIDAGIKKWEALLGPSMFKPPKPKPPTLKNAKHELSALIWDVEHGRRM